MQMKWIGIWLSYLGHMIWFFFSSIFTEILIKAVKTLFCAFCVWCWANNEQQPRNSYVFHIIFASNNNNKKREMIFFLQRILSSYSTTQRMKFGQRVRHILELIVSSIWVGSQTNNDHCHTSVERCLFEISQCVWVCECVCVCRVYTRIHVRIRYMLKLHVRSALTHTTKTMFLFLPTRRFYVAEWVQHTPVSNDLF